MALYEFPCIFLEFWFCSMFTEMNPAIFYGQLRYASAIPGDGSKSEDESASDSDCDNIELQPQQSGPMDFVEYSSDSDSVDEEDITLPPSCQTRGRPNKRQQKKTTTWRKGFMPPYQEKNFEFKGDARLPESMNEIDTPGEFFFYFFTKEIFGYIVEQSNIKALQDNINKAANITIEELEQFVGIVLYMSLVKLPAARKYWETGTAQQEVYETMTCNRWDAIKKYLHFNDNSNFKPRGSEGYDKLYKIRPLLDKIKDRLALIPKEEYLAVDEQIIPTKARQEIKQYNPAKPHKWGYTNFVLSGVSGFSYDFDLFAGEQSNTFPDGAPDLGVSANVVTRLTSSVPKHMNHKIFFDNWFNSPNLQVYLYQNGLLPLGTVRLNRVPNSNMPTPKVLKKQGRGTIVEKIATIDGVKLSLVSWFDNKQVNMLSAYVGSKPVTTKRRFFRKEKIHKEIPSPQVVDVYNRHMGGVDLLDSILGLYRIQLRSKKWYKKIFYHMIDMCAVNAWLLWRRCHEEYLPLYDFKLAVSEHLRKVNKTFSKKRGRPSTRDSAKNTPTSSRDGTPSNRTETSPTKRQRTRNQDLPLSTVRKDNVGHFPRWMKSRLLCQNDCTYRSYTMCEKCKVYLCYNDKRNCFTEFHLV